MTRDAYRRMEQVMLEAMDDCAHDSLHIYRVLYAALEIAQDERDVDMDVLVAACLLHDIGRRRQYDDPALCHAREGAQMAHDFLLGEGWTAEKAAHVRDCIRTHRFRSSDPPVSLEAKILFDADKIDAAGALGIARTMLYQGIVNEPLYAVDERGQVLDGTQKGPETFLREYVRKLAPLYDNFLTRRGREMALARREDAARYYAALLREASALHESGPGLLARVLDA